MTDKHSQSFFGHSTGLTIQSSSKNEPYIFFKCIKKKPDETWEKISQGEGKTIRCSLEEIIMILKVLKRKIDSWSGYHTYKENNTQISFCWENDKENKLWINIGDYSKMLGIAQIELLKLFLKHLIKEKIEFATISNKSQKINEHTTINQLSCNNNPHKINLNENVIEQSSIIKANEIIEERIEIDGSIKTETEKALLIVFKSGQEVWFPKSTIHSNYKPEVNTNQLFLIDKWIIEKNKIPI